MLERTEAHWPIYQRYWGKAQPIGVDGPGWHPLAYHCLDVAMVGMALMEADPRLAARLAAVSGLSADSVRRALFLALALHDIGKFAPSFQALARVVPDAPDVSERGLYEGHDRDGLILWRQRLKLRGDLLDAFWGPGPRPRFRPRSVAAWLESALCHHGRPREDSGVLANLFAPHHLAAVDQFVSDVIRLAERFGGAAEAPPGSPAAVSWRVAGITVLCDWIGSNQRWFPYHDPGLVLDDYCAIARERADRAVREARVLAAPAAAAVALSDLLPAAAMPTPLQAAVEGLRLQPAPQLLILEDQTGAGKTEAALALAGRMMAAGMADGIFVALPTMATANAMYARCATLYRTLFAEASAPTITLAHARRDLVLPSFGLAGVEEADYGDDEATASAACSRWLADDRRKATLADCGVGTIDQAVLAILPSKYQSLRLAGLARKALVVDEVHSHDPYLRALLCRLLAFHAAQGGSAILLSATLPAAQRQQYLEAFALGRGGGLSPHSSSDAYPLLTACDGTRVAEMPVAPRPGLGRRLAVRFVADPKAAASVIVEAAKSGLRACWIRNSVADAVEGLALVTAQVPDAVLFHARFAMVDRLDIEREVLARFGAGTPRRGGALVATQVVEQSLDLDFDVMVSDLAPIDALIQRAGRLWRRPQPDRAGDPLLHVLTPEPVDAPDAAWMRRVLPRAAAVYPDHAALWLTARLLSRDGALRLPEEARMAVEYVYGDPPGEPVPEALMHFRLRTIGKDLAAEASALGSALDFDATYVQQAGRWPDDHAVPTRLGEPQSQLRLARWDGARLVPWSDGEDWRAWRLSEATILQRHLAAEAPPADPALARAVKAVRATWPKWDASLLVPLTEGADGVWTAPALDGGGSGVMVRYDRASGLMVIR